MKPSFGAKPARAFVAMLLLAAGVAYAVQVAPPVAESITEPASALPATAVPVQIPPSSLKATFTQFGVPVTGEFKTFSGKVHFNPAKPEQTRAEITVQTASFDLEDPMYNEAVAGEDWFASKAHPTAHFVVKSVKPEGKRFTVQGDLTLRGVTRIIEFPAYFSRQGKITLFTGKARIHRLQFGIGQGDWADTALVEDDVIIDFKLVVAS